MKIQVSRYLLAFSFLSMPLFAETPERCPMQEDASAQTPQEPSCLKSCLAIDKVSHMAFLAATLAKRVEADPTRAIDEEASNSLKACLEQDSYWHSSVLGIFARSKNPAKLKVSSKSYALENCASYFDENTDALVHCMQPLAKLTPVEQLLLKGNFLIHTAHMVECLSRCGEEEFSE